MGSSFPYKREGPHSIRYTHTQPINYLPKSLLIHTPDNNRPESHWSRVFVCFVGLDLRSSSSFIVVGKSSTIIGAVRVNDLNKTRSLFLEILLTMTKSKSGDPSLALADTAAKEAARTLQLAEGKSKRHSKI